MRAKQYEVHVSRIETIVTDGVVKVKASSQEEAEIMARRRMKWDKKQVTRKMHFEEFRPLWTGE